MLLLNPYHPASEKSVKKIPNHKSQASNKSQNTITKIPNDSPINGDLRDCLGIGIWLLFDICFLVLGILTGPALEFAQVSLPDRKSYYDESD
jgi:hypothetical protein